MASKNILYIIAAVLVVGGGLFFFLNNNKGIQKETGTGPATTSTADEKMVDCGLAKDPTCFANRMTDCLPVTTKMMASDNKTTIDLTILGIEDNKCHFQRKINNVTDLNCFFPKGTMNWDTIDQTFGNDKGLQSVVDDACKKGW